MRLAIRHLDWARANDDKLYVCSGLEKGILTIDTDAHQPHQSLEDARAAKDLILAEWEGICGYRPAGADYDSSNRGQHFTMGVDFEGRPTSEVRYLYKRFERAINRLLRGHGYHTMVGSTEVKGGPPILSPDLSGMIAGSLTQFPIHRRYENVLQSLISVPDIPISQLEWVVGQIEGR